MVATIKGDLFLFNGINFSLSILKNNLIEVKDFGGKIELIIYSYWKVKIYIICRTYHFIKEHK
jgi:hypothetical protein